MKTCFRKIISFILILSLLLSVVMSLSSCSDAVGFVKDVIYNLVADDSDSNTEENLTAQRSALLSSVIIRADFEIKPSSSFYPGVTEPRTKGGSGVIYKLDKETGDAYIITNYHAIYHPDAVDDKFSNNISVYLYGLDDENYAISAEYVGGAFAYDIAILKISGSFLLKEMPVRAAEFADSEFVRLLDPVIAIGNAEAEGFSITKGSVSVQSEYLTMKSADNITDITVRVIRIDTPINNGNSGGGLYDANGRLVGIVNAKKIGEKVDNIAYAIPINLARAVAENIIYHSSYKTHQIRTYLPGITFADAERVLSIDKDGEILVSSRVAITKVANTSPLYNELLPGDTVLEVTVDGVTKKVSAKHHASEALLDIRPGSTVKFLVERDGKTITITKTITESMGVWQ